MRRENDAKHEHARAQGELRIREGERHGPCDAAVAQGELSDAVALRSALKPFELHDGQLEGA